MMSFLHRLPLGLLFALGASSAACGMSAATTFDGPASEPTASADAGGSSSGSSGTDRTGAPQAAVPSNGVMLVHAAEFPALRVCFEGRPEAKPIPDATTMPDANIVGLDIGTGIRLAPIVATKPLGKLYVIEVDPLRPIDDASTCAELICEAGTGKCLTAGRDYLQTAALTEASLGVGRLTVLALKGCGNGFQLGGLGVNSADCGPGWNTLEGNVSAKLIQDLQLEQRTAGVLPVQLVNLSNQLAPTLGGLTVAYGAVAASAGDGGAPDGGAPARENVATNPPLDQAAASKKLPLKSDDESVYGTVGFVIERKTGAGKAFSIKKSLAEVQEDSSPLSLPAEYYANASKYALLLLGDPRTTAANDPRRVHLIAVPMTDPADADAGADAGGEPDATTKQ